MNSHSVLSRRLFSGNKTIILEKPDTAVFSSEMISKTSKEWFSPVRQKVTVKLNESDALSEEFEYEKIIGWEECSNRRHKGCTRGNKIVHTERTEKRLLEDFLDSKRGINLNDLPFF